MAPPIRVLFLETSAIVDLVLKKGKHLELLEAINAPNTSRVTNNYVLMELKRGVIQYMCYLHEVCSNSSSLGEVVSVVAKLTGQPHRLGTCLELLTGIFLGVGAEPTGQVSIDEYLLRKAKEFLNLQAFRLWSSARKNLVDGLGSNPMECYRDIEGPTIDGTTLINIRKSRCTSSAFECSVKRFFGDNKKSFEAIVQCLDLLETKDEEQKKSRSAIHEATRLCTSGSYKISNRDGYQKCWKCGDAIIAVSAPSEAQLLTSNQKHFNVLGQALSKGVFPPPLNQSG